MQFAYLLGSNQTVLHRKYQVGETANIGVPMIQPGAGEAGPMQATTTALDNMVGVMMDSVTYQTAQNADASDPAAMGTMIISPDAVWRAKLSGGAASDTLLAQLVVTAADAAGLAITTGTSWSSPTYDEGVAWGFKGTNTGNPRKLTTVSTTVGTVLVAFPADIAVGDIFLRAPIYPLENHTVTLTTELNQVRADVAVAVNTGALVCVDVELYDHNNGGDGASFGHFKSGNHILGGVLS